MSGHSKWSTIKRKKGVADAKRGKIFTKLIREISTAARLGGGELDANPRLRLVVEKAKGANMPKDNIERAIQKGLGGNDSDSFDACVYEGYGPGGIAILLETLTDNKNRTVGEVRHILTRHGGNLGASGCVAYLFEKRGVVHVGREGVDADALLEAALDAGAEDVAENEDSYEVVTSPAEHAAVRDALGSQGFKILSAEIGLEPSTTVPVTGAEAAAAIALADALEDLDDVQNVYCNFDISDEEMASLS